MSFIELFDFIIYQHLNKRTNISPSATRGGVENTRLEAKAKAIYTKKIRGQAEAKDSPSEDRPTRGQGQECSRPRPRTKDTRASVQVFSKNKKGLQNFFSGFLK